MHIQIQLYAYQISRNIAACHTIATIEACRNWLSLFSDIYRSHPDRVMYWTDLYAQLHEREQIVMNMEWLLASCGVVDGVVKV